MKRYRLLAAVLFAVALAATAAAITIPKVTYTDTRLKNGLRVIVSPDRAAPVVSVAVAYNVGSRNERKGRTGFAHLFEHLMFKGSENVADGELAGLIENYGGSHNGQTDKDHTLYFEQVPSNQLDMVLFLEADRMRAPAITQENVDNQREAVKEERRLRMDNQPYGKTSEVIGELLFENFANEHSIIGSMADLDAASLEDFTDFFKTYYAPNNAVLAIAGDVDAKTALEKVRKYFEGIPSGPPPPPLDTTEPAQKEERRTVINDPLARLTLVDIAYQVPGGINPRHGRAVGAGDRDGLGPQLAGSMRASFGSSRWPCRPAPACVPAKGPTFMYLEGMAGPGKDPADGGEGDLRRSGKSSERADSGMGARQGAQRGAAEPGRQPRQLAAARDSARALYRVLQRSRDHQHALRAHRVAEDRRPAARRAPVSRARESRGGGDGARAEAGCNRCTRCEGCGRCAMKTRSALCPLLSALSVALLAVQAPVLGQGAAAPPAPPAAAPFKNSAPVSNDVIKVKLPRAQETQLSNGAYLMVLEDHRVPSVQFEIIMIGAGGYYDPPGMPGPRRHDRVADGRRHDDEELRADRAGARHDGRDGVGVGERGIADRDRHRLGADRSVRRGARAGVRHPAESELSGKGARPLQGARPRGARRAAQRSGLPEAGALLEGGLRRPSGVERRADARVAREDHARDARELPQEQLRARSRHHRRVGRHHACRSAHEIRGGAQGLGEERQAAARRHRSARPRADEDLARESARVRADRLHARRAGDQPHRIPTTTRWW